MFLCWLSAMWQVVVYDYDAAGNRVSRQVAVEQPRSPAPRHQHITEPELAAGRFLSPDPYVQAPDNTQNLNRYTYCLNNPLRYVDPTGEAIWRTDDPDEIRSILDFNRYSSS